MAPRKSREIEQSASSSASAASSASPAPQTKKSSKKSAAAPAAPAKASKADRSAKSEKSSKSERTEKSSRSSRKSAASAASDSAPAKERVKKTVYVLDSTDESRDAVPTFVPLPEENTAEELLGHLTRMAGLMRTMAASVSQLVSQVQSAHKRVVREGNRKRNKRVVDPSKPKTLSTFTYKMKVTPALLKFMNLPKDQYVSRVEATEAVTNYINANNLRVTEGDKKGTIRRDDALNKILAKTAQKKQKPGDNSPPVMYTDVTSKNLQAFLSHNYIEKAPEDSQPSIADVLADQQRRAEKKQAKLASRNAPDAAPAKSSKSSGEKKSSKKIKAAPVESDSE